MDRHLILTQARSGSNFLVDTLNEHPRLVNYGETLYPAVVSRKLLMGRPLSMEAERYLDLVTTSRGFYLAGQSFSYLNRRVRKRLPARPKRWHDVKSIGAKEFLRRMHVEGVDTWLADRPDVMTISLTRGDPFARVVSMFRLQASGAATSQRGGLTSAIHIEPAEFVPVLEETIANDEAFKATVDALAPERLHEVRFEDLMSERQPEVIAGVFAALGVEPLPVVSSFKRMSSSSLGDDVSNYDALVDAVCAAGHGSRLPESA